MKEEELKYQSAFFSQIVHTTDSQPVISANQQQQLEADEIQQPPLSRNKPQKMFENNMYPPGEIDQDKDETFLKEKPNTNPKIGVKDHVNMMVSKPYQSHPGIDGKLTAEGDLEMEVVGEDADLTALQQKENQEDGVAHLWQREMGVVDDNDRYVS